MTRVVVLGGGIVGMWTAEILNARGYDVVVWSAVPHDSTYSAAAVCVITPLFPWDPESQIFKTAWGWYERTIAKFKSLDEGGRFIEPTHSYEFGFEEDGERYLEKGFNVRKFEHLPFARVTIVDLDENVLVENHIGDWQTNTFGAYFTADLCNTEVFLRWLYVTLVERGVRFEQRSVRSLPDIAALEADLVFNCMGFHSGDVFPDADLFHVRGQSMFIDAEPLVGEPFGIASGHHAIFRHRKGFYLGSYFLEGEDEIHTLPQRTEYELSLRFARGPYLDFCRILKLSNSNIDFERIRRVNTGIRPYRKSGPRIEVERIGAKTIVHNYGHGAHGWTIGYASAEEAVRLAEGTV